MRIPLLHSAATVAVAAVLAAGCGGSGGGGGASSAASTPANAQVVEIDVAQSGFAFTKTTATAKAGPVELRSMNPQSVTHDISIKGNGVDQQGNQVSNGGVSTVTVTLKPGTYTYFCSVPGHEAAGMKGTLTVS
jgi:plastocyanin